MKPIPRFWNVIINPNSFRGKNLIFWSSVKIRLWENGFTFREHDSPSAARCNDIVAHLLSEDQNAFLVVGGDGTIHQVVNAILQNCSEPEKIILAVIPCGTGNDWARTHRIPTDVNGIVNMFLHGKTMLHDLGKITISGHDDTIVRYFINIAGLGFDAEVILRIINTRQYRYGRKLIYLTNLFAAWKNHQSGYCTLKTDEFEIRMPIFTIAVGIGKYNGHRMKQVPMAEPDDGLLDVIYIEPLTTLELIRQVPRLYTGKHIDFRKVHHIRTPQIEIIPEGIMYVEAEGELIGNGAFKIENISRKITILKSAF